MEEKCPICGLMSDVYFPSSRNDREYECSYCGCFKISDNFVHQLLDGKHEKIKHILSSLFYEIKQNGLVPDFILDENNIDNIMKHHLIPKKLYDKLGKLLLYIYKNTSKYGEIHTYEYNKTKRITYSVDSEENHNITNSLQKMGLINILNGTKQSSNFSITDEGMKYAEELLKGNNSSPKCFIARWFTPEIDEIYDSYIMPEITKLGFEPIVISNKEHNNDIVDEILSDIKKSKFIIADLTGHRGGVYFEAGYAYGLNLPVIWSCRKDWFNNEIKNDIKCEYQGNIIDAKIIEKRRIHFDIEHFPFIIWETKEELKTKIINRINATIVK
ncbi:MAG TPA: hypothetical protein PLE16_04175 [Spirochaetota bacterium]|nr:hypothetical protein [Bacilli bacterium]HPJ14123.1 hypothetical protein [Spirochaetota bacterium]HPM33780.1 hypothetical protein [Spirochaetota bacterium]